VLVRELDLELELLNTEGIPLYIEKYFYCWQPVFSLKVI